MHNLKGIVSPDALRKVFAQAKRMVQNRQLAIRSFGEVNTVKLQFISEQHIDEAVRYLGGKGHLPVTDASGKPNHRLMGAAWAALHGGYRGKKYAGPNKDKALSALKALYKSEKMDTPEESFVLDGEFFQEALPQSQSYSAIQSKVIQAINAKIKSGTDMDCDDDGPKDAGMCSSCGCACSSQYGCSCCPECDCTYPKTAWCMDLYPDAVVYSMEGALYQCDYSFDDQGDVQLGDPVAVETSYTPIEGAPTDCPESYRVLACNATQLEESAYDSATGKLTMTVIRPGLNKSKQRFYPQETLKRDYKVFENAKMFVDHQSDKEVKERPEGSVNNYVAQITKVWPESDGTIKAVAAVIDPPFKAKLSEMAKQGLLHEMGVSIRAIGEASEQEREGVTTNVVESLIAARSVDFVTYAGAGGQIEAMESAKHDSETDVDLVTEAVLRQRRPDIVSLIEKHAHNQETTVKSLETQLQEANTQLATLTKENTELKTKFEEAQKAGQKATVAAELTKQLTESKLPAVSQDRIRKQFAEATKTDGIAAAIKEEQDYVKSLGGSAKPGPKNLGAAANGTNQESNAGQEANLEEAFKLLNPNMTDAEAKLAAHI
jgi:hypothetical protein